MHHRRVILMQEMQNFSGEGAQPPPRPLPQWGGGHPLPTPHSLGASILTPPILKFCLRYCIVNRSRVSCVYKVTTTGYRDDIQRSLKVIENVTVWYERV